ncbi:MAG: AI-2E family transporter [Candidatus Zambryskibacteria bacterium]|nr:AI-2E family transporter [Candidatus Zambryskibacteria bacterium]
MEETKKISITLGSWVKAALVVAVFYALSIVSGLILVVVTAIVIASAIEPVAAWAKRERIPRLPVVILVYLLSILIVSGLFYFLLLPLVGDVGNFIKTLTIYSNSVVKGGFLSDMFKTQNIFAGLDTPIIIREMSSYLNEFSQFLSQGVFSSLSSIFGGVSNFFLILILSFYLVVQEDGISKFLKIITPLKHESYVINLWRRSQAKIGRWMQGQIIASVAVMILAYIGLLIVRVPHALLLAVSVGVFDLIPIFGPIIAAIPAIFVGFISGGTVMALTVGAIYLVVQQIESNFIYPLVHKKIVGVPPTVSIISVVAGWELAGFLGVVIAVPVAAAVMEMFSDFEERKKNVQ